MFNYISMQAKALEAPLYNELCENHLTESVKGSQLMKDVSRLRAIQKLCDKVAITEKPVKLIFEGKEYPANAILQVITTALSEISERHPEYEIVYMDTDSIHIKKEG